MQPYINPSSKSRTKKSRRHPPSPRTSGYSLSHLKGHDLIGRELLVCWDDGVWYVAFIVTYYPISDEYKLVYRADDGIEVAKLCDRRWMLAPKKRACPNKPVLDGAIIEFKYPPDGQRYKAMIYNYTHGGERLRIAYIDDHTTDRIKGGGWDFLTDSPCRAISDDEDEGSDNPAPRSRDSGHDESDNEDEDNDIPVPRSRDHDHADSDNGDEGEDNDVPAPSRRSHHRDRRGRTHDVGVRKMRTERRQRRGN